MTLSVSQRIVLTQQRTVTQTTFHQLRLLQVWMGWSLDDVIAVCHRCGFTGILPKALDGPEWMAQYDASPDAIGSVEQLRQQADRVRSEGLYYFAWTNPLDQGDIALQATLAGQIARNCDGVFLDVEPYTQFWGANRPAGDASQFMRWIRNEAPSSFIALQPDPRGVHLGEIRAWEWMPSVDALSGQHYWSDFQTRAVDELANAVLLGQTYGVPILPTLPGGAALETFPMDSIAQLPGFVVFRYGSTPEPTLEALGAARVAGFQSTRIQSR